MMTSVGIIQSHPIIQSQSFIIVFLAVVCCAVLCCVNLFKKYLNDVVFLDKYFYSLHNFDIDNNTNEGFSDN